MRRLTSNIAAFIAVADVTIGTTACATAPAQMDAAALQAYCRQAVGQGHADEQQSRRGPIPERAGGRRVSLCGCVSAVHRAHHPLSPPAVGGLVRERWWRREAGASDDRRAAEDVCIPEPLLASGQYFAK